MTLASRTFFLRLVALALMASSMVSCSSPTVGNGASISKVKYYHLVPNKPIVAYDPAITFERQHYLYGAVTKAEVMNRGGHYYTIFWKTDDKTQPVTVRFEYRQADSGLTTKTQQEEVTQVRRCNVSKFQVTGDEYQTGGRVTAWRVSVLRGNEELVSESSFLWK